MPPKKAEEHERKPLIGRVGTNLRVGIVGVPNVGKSTFFNVLTKSAAPAENFPFCTIDPNENKHTFVYQLSPMFQKNILFIHAEPENSWIDDIILDVILSLPAVLFGEVTPWDSILTLSPFIKQFSIHEALEKMTTLRGEMRIQSEAIFPLDSNESELNFKNMVQRIPLRIMLFGDKNAPLTEIGDLLANKFNTFLITPKELIVQQVKMRTKIGTWLYWNIMKGRGIPVWVVNQLLKMELKKEKYAHRGFILSHWPLIPELNAEISGPCVFYDEADCEIDKIYPDRINNYTSDNIVEEENEILSPKVSSTSSSNSVYFYEEKIQKIIRGMTFVNIDGEQKEVLSTCVRKQLEFIRYLWCTPQFIIFLDQTPSSNEFTMILDNLETFCLLNSQENVIHVDCRTGTKDIYNSICNRFLFISHKINYECTAMNPRENSLLTLHELCTSETILPNCKWWISKFNRICPVNLYFGRRRWCSSAYPVRYLRYLFLCHSSKDRTTFMENPGKYINLLPTCRIAIIGPHRVGKSTLAKHLGIYFKADIYKTHIQHADANMKDPNKEEIKALTSELNNLETLRLRYFDTLKVDKIEEWTYCVLYIINETVSTIFNNVPKDEKETNVSSELFLSVLADKYLNGLHKTGAADAGVYQLILKNAAFKKCIQNISSVDFLKWLAKTSEQQFLYRQYVLDSAPVNQTFWDELLANDELPDCVYFFKTPPTKKMYDIYSCTHSMSCINQNIIIKEILNNFKEWKDHFAFDKFAETPKNGKMGTNTSSYLEHLIELRIIEAIDFSQKYDALQTFLKENGVICVNIDISNQTWTRTIANAISDYLMTYNVKPISLYRSYLKSSSYSDGFNSEENMGAISSRSLKYITESDHSARPYLDYGSYQEWCPVLLKNDKCLLRGDFRYAAEYKNKIYVMHSEKALLEFLTNPNIFINFKPRAPLPKIIILGLSPKKYVKFAESLASALCIQKIPCMQLFTTFPHIGIDADEISIKNVENKYNEIKEDFLYELSAQFKNGGVICGFPLIFKQFNDLIINQMYPEYVFIFDDQEKMVFTVYQYLLRVNSLKQTSTVKASYSGSECDNRCLALTNTHLESEFIKEDIMDKARNILRPFFKEISKMEEACLKLRIPIIKLSKYYQRPQIINECVKRINRNRNRSSYFEEVKLISMDDSQRLLNSGYYWFSRFKYSCPVDVGRLITVNHYEGMSRQGNVYPCIHRDFIYFLNGKQNFKSFQRNPLDYINTCNPPQMNYPLRIAIYGPPKSGSTSICESISQELGLRIISSKDFPTGTISDSALITYLKIYKSSTPNGVILDNLILTPTFLVKAARNNVDISLVVILVPSFEKVLNNWFSKNKFIKNCPQFTLLDMHKQFCNTQKSIRCIRSSIHTCLFNIHYLDADANTWIIWKKVKHLIVKTTRSISGYKLKLLKNRCANVTCLNLFYETLAFKRSYNHFYCQVCLSLGKLNAFKYHYANVGPDFYTNECQELYNKPYGYSNNVVYNTFELSKPFEYTGHLEPLATQKKCAMSMFQYKTIVYWTCSIHTIDFMMNAAQYNIDSDTNKPLHIPFLVFNYTKKYVAYDSYCPIEYLAGKLIKGNMQLSVYYRKKVYLMANEDNTIEFLSYPEKYRKINFDPCLQLDNSGHKPFYGLDGEQLSAVLYDLANARPKHFVLSAEQSAACYIALRLQTESRYSKNYDYWHMSLHAFTQDCKTLDDRLKKYKERFNPCSIFSQRTHRVPVPDERFDFLCEYHKPASKVPAYLNVVDIAGLVKGAAEGQGLGNAFLSHISACDSIFHLCRAFEDPDVTHVEGEVDPVRDLDIICEELRLKDEEKLLQNLDKLEKVVARGGDKKLKPEYDSLVKVKNILVDEKKHLRFADWNVHDIETLNKYMFLTSKPVIYLVNLSDKDFIRKKNKWLAKIKEWVDKNDPGATIIPFSGHFEHDLAEKDESERKAYEEETKCKSVLDKIIVTGYKALQLEYFFTAGADEVKAWTIQKGTKAPQAAGRIHTDFEKGFIMAEVMHFKDFKEEGSEAAAKSAGKYRQQGRNYVVEDGDIIFFKFNAGAGLKDAKKK